MFKTQTFYRVYWDKAVRGCCFINTKWTNVILLRNRHADSVTGSGVGFRVGGF
jgi:hypothetical protein